MPPNANKLYDMTYSVWYVIVHLYSKQQSYIKLMKEKYLLIFLISSFFGKEFVECAFCHYDRKVVVFFIITVFFGLCVEVMCGFYFYLEFLDLQVFFKQLLWDPLRLYMLNTQKT